MSDFLSPLFTYNQEMNDRIILQLTTHTWPEPEPLHRLMSHILTAHHIWNQRLAGNIPRYGVWESVPVGTWQSLHQENTEESVRLLQEFSGSQFITYTNSRGEAFSNSVQDILFHVINHSTYHRAQIATEVRRQGGNPLATDYIFYKRS
ncbi:DinB family protein [Arundinibacter roseus]|uniref:Damage-inducible protein DinB n=1 Tax=Arundinibacter roseus TaxID=2070510 RepID=A0A4V2X944_9BACT|nr:DinB family protein [Arundinibacter roseus]TDB62385.1 damage-inducible protein DinB [Arundinibacter roseus]